MRFVFSFLFWLSFSILVISCQKENPAGTSPPNNSNGSNNCEQIAIDKGWIFHEDNQKWLFGGSQDSWHFNVSNWDLKACQLRFGLGREAFDALIEPQYEPLSAALSLYSDSDRFLIVEQASGIPKTYPISLMIKHEVINDVIDGHPVMVAYCVLADLGAVYTRNYCGETLTFALSGYTYHDPEVWDNIDAVVLGDRDTESLWWPLIDRAVSGDMNGTQLEKYAGGWQDLTLSQLEQQYDLSNVLVLKTGQHMDIPQDWAPLEEIDCD